MLRRVRGVVGSRGGEGGEGLVVYPGGGSRHGLVVLVASAGSVDVVLLPGVDAGRAPGRGPTSGERGWWVLGLPGGKEKRRAGGSTPWWLGQAEVRGGRFTRGGKAGMDKESGCGCEREGRDR